MPITVAPLRFASRSTSMTGRMSTLHGVRHNGIPLSLSDTNFVELLRAAGYRTALVGKSHLQNFTGQTLVDYMQFFASYHKAAGNYYWDASGEILPCSSKSFNAAS